MKNENEGELTSLNSELNRLEKTKEELFSQSKNDRDSVFKIRNEIKRIKHERNSLTDSVKKIKIERDLLNKQLKEKIAAFKKIMPVRKPKDTKAVKVNVPFIRKEIKAMEYNIETEALSFDKEQKLMKIIKEKKKQIEGSEPAKLSPEAKAISDEIDLIRKKADEAHKTMQDKAAESQKKHEEFISLSNKLKEIDTKQKEIEVKIKETKQKLDEINQKLGSKLEQAVAQKKEHREERREQPRHERRKEQPKHDHKHANIEEMQHKAEEKLKKGGKLTTEDLLAFQNKH